MTTDPLNDSTRSQIETALRKIKIHPDRIDSFPSQLSLLCSVASRPEKPVPNKFRNVSAAAFYSELEKLSTKTEALLLELENIHAQSHVTLWDSGLNPNDVVDILERLKRAAHDGRSIPSNKVASIASSFALASPGRRPNLRAGAVARMVANVFMQLTCENNIPVTKSKAPSNRQGEKRIQRRSGTFVRFLEDIYRAMNIDASAEHHAAVEAQAIKRRRKEETHFRPEH